MRRPLKAIATSGLSTLIGGLLVSVQIIPAFAQHHHSSPHHSSPRNTTTKPSIISPPSPSIPLLIKEREAGGRVRFYI